MNEKYTTVQFGVCKIFEGFRKKSLCSTGYIYLMKKNTEQNSIF